MYSVEKVEKKIRMIFLFLSSNVTQKGRVRTIYTHARAETIGRRGGLLYISRWGPRVCLWKNESEGSRARSERDAGYT